MASKVSDAQISAVMATLGARGGEARTKAKAAAARANGAKGGRPKKKKKTGGDRGNKQAVR